MKLLFLFLLAFLSYSQAEDFFAPTTFVKIRPGTFIMGSPESEKNRKNDEVLHKVTLTHAFEMQNTLVTQKQWHDLARRARVRAQPSSFTAPMFCPTNYQNIDGDGVCPNHPVEQILWSEATKFANAFSELNRLKPCYDSSGHVSLFKNIYDCPGYRLPTEAEWEYAARAGSQSPYFFGDDETLLSEFSIYRLNNPGTEDNPEPAEVGSLKANPLGLYDMNGNILEWVHDTYEPYSKSEVVDPQGPTFTPTQTVGVMRGGTFFDHPERLRSAYRETMNREWLGFVGLRLVRTVKE